MLKIHNADYQDQLRKMMENIQTDHLTLCDNQGRLYKAMKQTFGGRTKTLVYELKLKK